MPSTFLMNDFSEHGEEKRLYDALFEHFKDFLGNYKVTVLGHPQRRTWQLRIEPEPSDGTSAGLEQLNHRTRQENAEAILRYVAKLTQDFPRAASAQ